MVEGKELSELSKWPNIGKELEKQLIEVEITTIEQLKRMGSKQAWLLIKEIDRSACYNRLCALEGAIQGIRWHYLPEETKTSLQKFYNQFA